jgi:glucuronate isomerase
MFHVKTNAAAGTANPFMGKHFLLTGPTAVRLFESLADKAPIVDFHCHIPPADVAADRRFTTITGLWLGGDHYKWRAMRSNGVPESHITGSASDREKFQAWAQTLPMLVGNPLYHWSHLELQRYFDIHTPLGPETAEEIWQACNRKLAEPECSAKGLIRKSNVKALCTTDDPTDSLEHHLALRQDSSFSTRMLPTFRPDKALYLERDGFREWVDRLGAVAGESISDLDGLTRALAGRIAFFDAVGCRLSDHSLEPVVFEEATAGEADAAFQAALDGRVLTGSAIRRYRTWLMVWLAAQYAGRGWAMQLHMLAQRNNNTRMFRALGPDTGFDTMADDPVTGPLARLMDAMAQADALPKTILYSLNPKDFEALGALAGCFQGEGIPGKIQLGAAWWFNDTRDGMEKQLRTLGNLGALGRFVGMLTDSRSLVSYPRHEYFRRILCNLIGGWVDAGEFPDDGKALEAIMLGICHRNAEQWLNLPLD